jgi:hypothetical protein
VVMGADGAEPRPAPVPTDSSAVLP